MRHPSWRDCISSLGLRSRLHFVYGSEIQVLMRWSEVYCNDGFLRILVAVRVAPRLTEHYGSLAEWSKAPALGAGPKGRGFEPHSCHYRFFAQEFVFPTLRFV